MVGTVIGNYKLLQMIGAGGMGTVYEAVQQPIGRRVAIKVLHPEFAHDRDVLKRFFNEARAANLINHPSIVQVSDYGQLPNGSAYLAMEYLDGFTLDDHVIAAGGKISPDQAQHIAWQLASALSAAHTAGIVHRDLKPSNIMLIQDAIMPGGVRVKILDFGVAKLGLSAGVSSHKTRTGAVLGTPTYMAPEQCLGAERIDGKVDVYALGIILFIVLAGVPPFAASSDLELLNMQVSSEPPALRQLAPTIPNELAELIHRMLRKKAAERPSMAEVVSSLQRLGASQSVEHLVLSRRVSGDLTAMDAVGPTHPRPKFSIGTLAAGFGQKLSVMNHGQRLLVALTLAVTALGLFWGIRKARVKAPAAAQTSHASTPAHSELGPQNATVAAPASIELDSTPSGAQVFDAEGEQAMGTTPWSQPISIERGDLWLLLRKPGFHDRVLHLKPRLGLSIQRHEVLVPLQADRKQGKSAAKRQTLRMNDVKQRFFANPDGGGQVDIPDTYRIVD